MKARQELYDNLSVVLQQLDDLKGRISKEEEKDLEEQIADLKGQIAREENLGKRGKYTSKESERALLTAVKNNKVDIVRMLIETGVDVSHIPNLINRAIGAFDFNLAKKRGLTCSLENELQHSSSSKKRIGALKLLLNAGAKVTASDISTAISMNDIDLVKLLLDAGVCLNKKSNRCLFYRFWLSGWTIFALCMVTLLSVALTLQVSGHFGWLIGATCISAIVLLAWGGSNDYTRFDVEEMIKKKRIETPMEHAVRKGDKQIVNLLVEYGAKVRPRELWVAAEKGDAEIVKILKAELTKKGEGA